jgi:AcrR family transcriptional regulator
MAAAGRGKGRPRLTEAAEIDRAIREAASKVLREHGEVATINAVAEAAGLSRKSVYARYPNKVELFLSVMREQLEAVKGVEFDRSGSFEDRLRRYIEAALEVIGTPASQAIQRILTVNPAYMAALRLDMISASHKIFLVPLVELLQEANERGEVLVDDPEATARVVMPMLFAESFDWDKTGNILIQPVDRPAFARRVARIVTRGLLPRENR